MRELLDTLILLGVLQGAGLTALLAARRTDPLANRLLAALTGSVAAMVLLGYCEKRWAFDGQPHLLGLTAPLPFLFGPLLYLYVVALTRPVARFDARWLVHALPFLIDVIYMTQQFYLLDGDAKLRVVRAYQAGQAPASLRVIESLEMVQAVVYLAFSWMALQRYGRKMRGYFSDLARVELRWLRAMVLLHAATWSIAIAMTALRIFGVHGSQLDALGRGVHIGSTLVIFLTGYISLFQPEVFQKAGAAAELEPRAAPSEPEPTPHVVEAISAPEPTPADAPRLKYQRNRIDDDEAEALVKRLLALMQSERPYRDGALTLPVLADMLGVTPHALSQLLNVRLEKTFYAFINAYRVAAVKDALADRVQNARGVLEIAFEAGFNSKSTLNSFFKRETGMTPTEYRAQAQSQARDAQAA